MREKFLLIFLCITIFTFNGCKKMEKQQASSLPQQQLQAGSINNGQKIDSLKALLKEHPESVSGWIQLGNLSMDSGLFKDAIFAYEQALKLDPKNTDVRVDLGTCYNEIGQPKKAIEEYKKALEIKPDHQNGLKNMAVVLASGLNDKKGAAESLERYLKYYPNAPDRMQIQSWIIDLRSGK